MGTRERRQRQLAEREQFFLEAARDLIRESGLLSLQMCRIAERCEYAVGTLYQHFASKEDLLLALTTLEVQEHCELFQRAGDWDACSRDRMLAIGVADKIFMQRNPDHFRVLQYALCEVVWKAASPERREAFLTACKPIGDSVVAIVEDGVRAGELELRGQTPQELCTGFWALCNGTHNLVHAEGMLDDFMIRDAYRLMCEHIQMLLNGYGWQPLAQPGDRKALDALISRIKKEVFHDLCKRA